jgi:ketosteroid isomerase-like protein
MRDEEQIRLTLALYSRFNDYQDEEAWTLLYTPDAAVVLGGQLSSDMPQYAPDQMVVTPAGREWHGRNAIRAFMRDINLIHRWETCHLVGNVVIAIDGDTASLDADMLFHNRAGDGPWRNTQFNRYTADLVRAGTGWLFSRWTIQSRLTITSRSAAMAAAAPLPGIGEINKTLALYAHFLDDHDAENWSKLFAEDARFILPSAEYTGRAAIEDFARANWARHPDRRVVHFCTTSVVRPDSETATADIEVSEYEPAGPGAWQARGHGRYYDRLIRQGARWLIQERRVKFPLWD